MQSRDAPELQKLQIRVWLSLHDLLCRYIVFQHAQFPN